LDQGAEALVVLDNAMRELGPLPSLQIPALEVEVALGRFESALTRLASLDRDGQMRFDLMQLRGEILLKAKRFAEARETFEFIVSGIECQRAPLSPRIEGIIKVVRAHLQELYALNDR
jgi:predicted negative regulator of RcsB-dependent stress response